MFDRHGRNMGEALDKHITDNYGENQYPEHCPKCGYPINEGEEECSECGHVFDNTEEEE